MATPSQPVSDPRNTSIASGKRSIQIATQQVQPPTPLYLQPEDSLTLNVYTAVTFPSNPVNLVLRWLRPDGEIVSVVRRVPLTATTNTLVITLGEGFLLSATLTSPTLGVTEPGQVF